MPGSVNSYLLMTGAMLPRKKVYDDSAVSWFIYYCDADHGSALTDPVWMVTKGAVNAAGDVEEVWSTDNYNNVATDLATVALLTFS